MKKHLPIVIFITTSTEKEAKRICDKLLNEKLVACVNIIKGINSHFWWQDKIEFSNEMLLIAKTKSQFFNDIVKLVKKLHSYEVPEIIAIPIVAGSKEYLRWINSVYNDK